MKYRSRNEIVFMILESASTGATKTKIMYKAYLSYAQLKEYLSYMESNNLIKYEKEMQVYTITEKGRRMMKLYEEIDEMTAKKGEEKIAKAAR
ncbi:MAG: DUF4364 family protein [Thaumarchaeota archaeon]|nr:DUF4364 family protein [Nitrososphaerota archaeon]